MKKFLVDAMHLVLWFLVVVMCFILWFAVCSIVDYAIGDHIISYLFPWLAFYYAVGIYCGTMEELGKFMERLGK